MVLLEVNIFVSKDPVNSSLVLSWYLLGFAHCWQCYSYSYFTVNSLNIHSPFLQHQYRQLQEGFSVTQVMAKGGIVLADTYDLSVNPGDGEQNRAFSAYLMIICGWEDVEKFLQFKHKMYSLNEVAWVSFVSFEFCQMLFF